MNAISSEKLKIHMPMNIRQYLISLTMMTTEKEKHCITHFGIAQEWFMSIIRLNWPKTYTIHTIHACDEIFRCRYNIEILGSFSVWQTVTMTFITLIQLYILNISVMLS